VALLWPTFVGTKITGCVQARNRVSAITVRNFFSAAWRKIKQTMELPCVVIGYRTGPDGLRDLIMASLVDGKPAFAGTVELGIHGKTELVRRLQARSIARPVVPCSLSAMWVKPDLFGKVRFCGWRPGGVWRDPVVVGWDG
jgi:ATP-dependent DNA ligase